MSRFYQELHDRELLQQAESVLRELQSRQLIDIWLPPTDLSPEESQTENLFPRRFSALRVENGRLVLDVEQSFFRR
ncbi:MAG: hypothetical protein JO217_13295 [Acidobacteriaceae bacterium]|nr:hypothetical protein [Acidobacteriaceae bacterium]MBV9443652.1 hypothetical protein [Acidobacteriaceae bacterium]